MAGETPCLEYDGARNARGYGVLPKSVHGSRLAHRAALAAQLGRPVEGVALHDCDNPPCISTEPGHVREGTQAENMADAAARGRARGGRYDATHCVHGHVLSGDNLRLKPSKRTRSGYERICKACARASATRVNRKRRGPLKRKAA